MEFNKEQTFTEFVKDYIIDRLPEYEGNVVNPCYLADEITSNDTTNGTFTFSTKLALELVMNWNYDCGDYIDYQQSNFGKVFVNPLNEPEKTLACMVRDFANIIIPNLEGIDDILNSEEEIELTEEVIQRITSAVEDYDEEIIISEY